MRYLFSCFVLLFLSTLAYATPIITFDDVYLNPNQADQMVPVVVMGGDMVEGVNFNISVEAGGPDFTTGAQFAPRITDINLVDGTIFDGNNTGQNTVATFDQAWVVGTTTSNGNVPADGVLAYVTFDTTGFADGSGPFSVSLSDPSGSPTDFAGVQADLVGRQIIIGVPEPSTLLGALLGATLIAGLQRQRAWPPK